MNSSEARKRFIEWMNDPAAKDAITKEGSIDASWIGFWEGWKASIEAAPTPPAQEGLKVEFTKEWCMNMAQLEGDSAIGAGAPAQDDDHTCTSNPVVAHETGNVDDKQDDEPVASLYVSRFRGHLENTQFEYLGDLPDGTYKLYTRPDNSGLRKAVMKYLKSCDHGNADERRRDLENLRAALEGK